MQNDDEATRAIMELNGTVLNGNRLNVEVCASGISMRLLLGVLSELYALSVL